MKNINRTKLKNINYIFILKQLNNNKMQMHEWERQEKLLEKIEAHQIEDCLQYNTFAYEKHEWDNIPAIVPRYVIYLSKYMAGIVGVCKEFSDRERTDQLRADLVNQL